MKTEILFRGGLVLAACAGLTLLACDSSDSDSPSTDAGVTGGSGGAGGEQPVGGTTGGTGGEQPVGGTTGGAGGEQPVGGTGGAGGTPMDFSTAALIEAYLTDKPLVMAGEDIPSHPNGFNEDVNFGNATQCYSSVTMTLGAGIFHVVSQLGTLENAPQQLDVGECNHDLVSMPIEFNSVSHVIENVTENGACFDFSINYGSFAQEGRGRITESTVELELYFKDGATGIRCADGMPGDGATAVSGQPFEGNALQVYRIGQ